MNSSYAIHDEVSATLLSTDRNRLVRRVVYVDSQGTVYLTIIVAIALLELALQRFRIDGVSERDGWLDLFFFLQSMMIVGPLIAFGLGLVEQHLLPSHANRFINAPTWLQFVAFILFDDLVQYWFHRAVHRTPWLWPLHMPHHSPSYMGVRMVFRNGFFYTLVFPNVWASGVLVYLGFGKVYFFYATLKAIVTMLAHSELRWDAPLYRWSEQHRWLRPLVWVMERTVSTPATHFAHHSASDDALGNSNGNFGNLLFLWDVLFGTALITRRYPETVGLAKDSADRDVTWPVMIFYPLFRRSKAQAAPPLKSLP